MTKLYFAARTRTGSTLENRRQYQINFFFAVKQIQGDRFSFPDSFVDVYFMSDDEYQYSGFNISVIDGFEQANNIVTTYDTRITKKEDLNFNENSKDTE